MVSCALRNCNSRSAVHNKENSSGRTFHRFPKDVQRQKLWIKFVNRGDWKPSKYSALCSLHFDEVFFDRTSKIYVRLRDNAVPTIKDEQDALLLPPSSKVRVISNILISPPNMGCYFNQQPSTSKFIEETFKETVSPRKRKLMKTLSSTLEVSKERKRKLVLAQKKLFRREKRIASMKQIVQELHKQNFMQTEYLDIISKLGGPDELFLRQYRKAKKQPLPSRYSEQLKVFALTLHYYSPSAYNYVRRIFNTCLPHTRTLSGWYQNINGEPGFTTEAFDALRLKVSSQEKKVVCSLIMDEMSIRQHEEWVPGKDKCYGYVDLGTGSKEMTIAKDAFVFLLNCLNGNWKIPIGYFLIAGITGEQKKDWYSNVYKNVMM